MRLLIIISVLLVGCADAPKWKDIKFVGVEDKPTVVYFSGPEGSVAKLPK